MVHPPFVASRGIGGGVGLGVGVGLGMGVGLGTVVGVSDGDGLTTATDPPQPMSDKLSTIAEIEPMAREDRNMVLPRLFDLVPNLNITHIFRCVNQFFVRYSL